MKSPEHIETMRKRYDEFAPVYVSIWSKLEGYSHLVKAFLEENAKPGMRVLDIGCGPGHFTQELGSSYQITGFDLSEAMLAEARKNNPTGQFYVHSYYDPIPEAWGKFDLVLGVGSLDFCEDIDTVVGHISRACNPGAKLLLNFCERRAGIPGHEERSLPITPERMPGVNLIFYSFNEMTNAIQQHGLQPERYFYYKGYHNQYHDLTIRYGMWHLTKHASQH